MRGSLLIRRVGELAILIFGLNYFFRFYQGSSVEEAHTFASGLGTILAAGLNTLSDVAVGLIGYGAVELVLYTTRRTVASPWRYAILPVIGLPCFAVAVIVGLLLFRDAADLVRVTIWALPRYLTGIFDPYLPGTFLLVIGGLGYLVLLGIVKLYEVARRTAFRPGST